MTQYTGTYSPDDNKLRLYASSRLDAETFARVKEAAFKWAPKQDLFVAPMWTPARADLLLELCGEIGDEDTSLVARAEERAERFEDYKEKRTEDANRAHAAVKSIADQIPFGQPILVGHHSERHARKDAQRIENGMRRAVQMWDTAQYWKSRAAGAISAAKYKERPDVRARRIKTIEADKRRQERTRDDCERFLKLWRTVHETDTIKRKDGQPSTIKERAMYIANRDPHVFGTWGDLERDKITGEEAQANAIAQHERVIVWALRWIEHYDNRLAYERAMQDEAGGIATDKTKPEKGGACKCWASRRGGFSYIVKVNKVSVTVLDNWGNGGGNFSRTMPFDKLSNLMTAAEVQEARDAGRLVELEDKTGFVLRPAPQPDPDKSPEETLREIWAAKGVPEEKQAAILADITAKAQPGAQVGPFTIGEPTETTQANFDAMREQLKQGVQVVSAPQLFPTPPTLAARMVELAEIQTGHLVLEPSAGTGVILDAIRNAGIAAVQTAVEINYGLVDRLRGRFDDVRQADFLQCNGGLGNFDRILMNPPFANGQDIAHIKHAASMLKPGGKLVAICANGPRQNEQLRPLADEWEVLPPGTFAESGTMVSAALLVITS